MEKNAYLLGKFGCFDFDESCADCFHVRLNIVEHHSTRTDGILVLISVNARIDHSLE